MNKEELNKILELHAAYLKGDKKGRRANLRGTDLRGTNLRHTNLRYTDLRGTDLRYTNLNGAKDGDKPLEICKTVLGLKWNILMLNQDVTVGCEKYTYEEWKAFSEEEIVKMDSDALEFYPVLMGILDHEYGKLAKKERE